MIPAMIAEEPARDRPSCDLLAGEGADERHHALDQEEDADHEDEDLDRLERRPQQRQADDDRQDAEDRAAGRGCPVSPSRVNELISEKIPLTNSQAAKKMLTVTIVAPG